MLKKKLMYVIFYSSLIVVADGNVMVCEMDERKATEFGVLSVDEDNVPCSLIIPVDQVEELKV